MATYNTLAGHLISLPTAVTYSAATQHPFLASAGQLAIKHELLSFYLSQDRSYAAHAYPRFIGTLISRIPFDSTSPEQAKLNQRILSLLVFSLTNVVREVNFFDDTAKECDLHLEGWKERKGTRDYTAEMARVASLGTLEDGLVFLWAMEQVYLESWAYVVSLLEKSPKSTDSDVSTTTKHAVTVLADNWTCEEFRKFVDEIRDLVNDLGIAPGSEAWSRAEGIWERVVELEEGFWPREAELASSKY